MAVDRATEVKNAMISGLWANSNLDDGKNTRQDALKSIDTHFEEAVARIYGSPEAEIDFNDPFFAAMNVPESSGSDPDRTTITDKYEVDQT